MNPEYNETLEDEYEHFSAYYDGAINYDDYRCLVDIEYRKEYGVFPNEPSMKVSELRDTAIKVGTRLIDEMQEDMMNYEQAERTKHRSKTLVKKVEKMLNYRSKSVKIDYPYSRRFYRKDVWEMENEDFDEMTIEFGEGYEDALNALVKEGVFKMIEQGGKSKYDIFEAVEV